jgi:hypothetical protein
LGCRTAARLRFEACTAAWLDLGSDAAAWQPATVTLPPAARAVAAATSSAVAAAQARDGDAYEEATVRIAALDPHRVGKVLGAVVRRLLEELHPDGLDGDDVRAVLERCVRNAADWYPPVDPNALVVLITAALGIEATPEEPADTARQAPLLTADLLTARGRPFETYLAAAFADIAAAETHGEF